MRAWQEAAGSVCGRWRERCQWIHKYPDLIYADDGRLQVSLHGSDCDCRSCRGSLTSHGWQDHHMGCRCPWCRNWAYWVRADHKERPGGLVTRGNGDGTPPTLGEVLSSGKNSFTEE